MPRRRGAVQVGIQRLQVQTEAAAGGLSCQDIAATAAAALKCWGLLKKGNGTRRGVHMQASLDRPGSGVLAGVPGGLPGWQWGPEETTCRVQLQSTYGLVSLIHSNGPKRVAITSSAAGDACKAMMLNQVRSQ